MVDNINIDNINMETTNYKNDNSCIIIMAGGLGKRMNSDLPKVLHKIKNKPMIVHILETSLKLNIYKIGIVVGKHCDIIKDTISQYFNKDIIDSKIYYIIQNEPMGTGHAIMCCKKFLKKMPNYILNVCILSGDVPFISAETINKLINSTQYSNVLISLNKEPYGYGRIILKDNKIIRIVEEKDCTIDEKKITLINTGIYAFNIQLLIMYIDKLSNKNNANEYYLTEIFELFTRDQIFIDYNIEVNLNQVTGVNTQEQLVILENYIQ